MTIDVIESEERLKKIELELKKIVNVLAVQICHPQDYIQTEMVLVKISKNNAKFKAFLKEMECFQTRVIYRHADTEIFEFSGDREKVEKFINICMRYDVISIVRTGTLAMPKLKNVLDVGAK